MDILATFWWLFFFTAVGLCLGSFLNAVVYRLPRDRSLRRPLWSFCPACGARIRWYDNLPIISFLLLRGRCRDCGAVIATRYLVIEASMALIVLLLLDALFIAQVRAGISDSPFGLTDRLAADWPVLTAHVILFASLLSMSVIDLEHYWVDVRFTNLATAAGFLLHILWTPRHSMDWTRPFDTTAVMCLCAAAGLALTWLLAARRTAPQDASVTPDTDLPETRTPSEPPSSPAEPVPSTDPTPYSSVSANSTTLPLPPSRVAGWVAVGLLVTLAAVLLLGSFGAVDVSHSVRALVPLGLFFLLIVWESKLDRPSDQQIATAIEEERHQARRMVLTELAWFLPAVIAGAVGWWLMARSDTVPEAVHRVLYAPVSLPGPLDTRHWMPMLGLATAATGYVLAGALGWGIRVVFTLVFGKEAFGSGDIHLMAAAGCVAGWPVVLLGFFLTSGLALVGWVAALPFKRARALPLGPWLSLSFLIVVIFYDSILRWPIIQRAIQTMDMLFFRNSQLVP